MTSTQKKTLFGALGILLAFGIGFGWQFQRARTIGIDLDNVRAALDSTRTAFGQQLDSVQAALAFQQLEGALAAAAVQAQQGNYEAARQLASDFFTGLQSSIAAAPVSAQGTLHDILSRRDGTITALSRADAQSGPALAQMFVRFREALGQPTTATPTSTKPDSAAAGADDT